MQISVIGTGYVGLVHGVVLADLGNDVICVDNNPEKLAKLRSGKSPIYEEGLEDLIQRTLASGRLKISDSVAEATRNSEIIFIAVGTPAMPDGSPDLRAVYAVATEIGKNITKHTVVVNKSTVPVGSGDLVANILREQGLDDSLFHVVSNPEFLREGSAVWDTQNPDRIVIGARNPEAAERLKQLYASFECPIIVTDVESAELIKYASNCFLATKISFINAFSRLCELCGGNVADVAYGMGLDDRIGPKFLGAGLGWGGSCFPKDTAGMISTAERLGYDFSLLKAAVQVNDEQIRHFYDRIEARFGDLRGKTIGLLGLAFKPNTDDIRYAKSLDLIKWLSAAGATIRTYDPAAMDAVRELYPDITYCDGPYPVAEGADALVLVTEWGIFKSLDFEKVGSLMREKVMFDGRRVLNREKLQAIGFEVFAVGA